MRHHTDTHVCVPSSPLTKEEKKKHKDASTYVRNRSKQTIVPMGQITHINWLNPSALEKPKERGR